MMQTHVHCDLFCQHYIVMISTVPLPDAAGYLVIQRKRGMRWVFRFDHRWRWVHGLGNVAQYVGQHDSDSEAEYFVR